MRELRNALQALGLSTDTAQAAAVMQRYDDDASGRLELPEFRRLVQELRRFSGGGSRPAALGDDVRSCFNRYDTDRSGDIDVSELKLALNELGLNADSAQARSVMSKYDKDASGALQFDEFRDLVTELRKFKGGGIAKPAAAAEDDDIERAFRHFDTDRSGDIDVSELTAALHHLGMNANSSAARQVMQRYDQDGKGSLTRQQFRKLVVELRRYQTQR